jgi:hypothetical protein
MDFRDQQNHASLLPMIAAAAVAALSTAALFVFEIAPLRHAPQSTIGMVTSAAVDRAGATVLPTNPAIKPKPISYTR